MRRIALLAFLALNLLALAGCGGVSTSSPAPTSTQASASSPALNVYVASQDGSVTALNAADGKARRHLYALGPVFSPPLLVNGSLYLGANDGKVTALRSSDGKLLWSYQAEGSLQAPLVLVNNTLYLVTSNTVVALNRADGMPLWHTPVAAEDTTRRMLVIDGLIYLSSDDPTVDVRSMTVLNVADGSVHWRYQGTQGAIDVLNVVGDSVYVEETLQADYGGVAENVIHVLNTSDGKERWHFSDGKTRASVAAMEDGGVYLLSGQSDSSASPNTLSALSASDGTLRSRIQLADDQVGQWFQANEAIYLDASSGTLYALDASNGKLQPVQSGQNNAPVTLAHVMMVSNGVLYGNSFPDAGLVAFNMSDWSLKWRYPTSESLGINAVIDGMVYAEIYDSAGANNAVYALKEGDTSLLWRYNAGKTFPVLAVG